MSLKGIIKKALRVYHTVKFLKSSQVFYQLKYRTSSVKSLGPFVATVQHKMDSLIFKVHLPQGQSATNDATFVFLNLQVHFNGNIDWDYQANGKLWNYNLQYFNYLQQQSLSNQTKQAWLKQIGEWLKDGRLKPEPYPVSLRVMNTIRFLSNQKQIDAVVIDDLYAQLAYLNNNLEYHILGNHLLENAFALFMGGYAFGVDKWRKKAKAILYKQLNEQILNDGAHFELSPMYHQIILFRVLELSDWYTEIEGKDTGFLSFINQKAADMLQWLQVITFSNGDIPHFNDSATGIAFTTEELLQFAAQLKINTNSNLKLKDSGYRKYVSDKYECVIDVGAVGPSYQPGHSHSDALSFVLYVSGLPLIVDSGTSTYQIGPQRNYERSTAAHNTVEVAGQNQSDVWGGFRVGQRAEVTILSDLDNELTAMHNGYQKTLATNHRRSFNFEDGRIIITDVITSADVITSKAYFHFNAGVDIEITSTNNVLINKVGVMAFGDKPKLQLQNYTHANGYNKYLAAVCLSVEFDRELQTVITFL